MQEWALPNLHSDIDIPLQRAVFHIALTHSPVPIVGPSKLQSVLLYTGALTLLVLAYRTLSGSSMPAWSSPYEGWHARAHPHPSPDTFTPTRDSLAFAVLLNAQADPEGFIVALFKPNVAVDSMGRILAVDNRDFEGMMALAQQTTDLPQTGSFMNTWRIERPTTSQPIERLFVPEGTELVETSVQGFDKRLSNKLERPVDGYEELPDVLVELFGLIHEGREGYQRGQEDRDVIARIKAVLGDV